jgi:hypothetical protein
MATISFFGMRAAILAASFAFVIAAPAAAQLEGISNRDAINALKGALERGTRAAVAQLGRENGFYGDGRVRIPLPESLRRAEKNMRRFGMGRYADELHLALNRAAEAAAPEAQALFVDAVKKMSVQDAKGILTGGDTAATEYFRRTTAEPLRQRFLPIVQRATAQVGLAQKYNEYASYGVRVGLVSAADANLDAYVTQKALDGLYFMVAEEEKKIRKDPVGTASSLLAGSREDHGGARVLQGARRCLAAGRAVLAAVARAVFRRQVRDDHLVALHPGRACRAARFRAADHQ